MNETNDEKVVKRQSRKGEGVGLKTPLDPNGVYSSQAMREYFETARRAYAYTRLSRSEGDSETSHFETMRRKANRDKNPIEIIGEFRDIDESSQTTLENPGLNDLYNEIALYGGVDLVIIPTVARLSRSGFKVVSEAVERFKEYGVPVWFCDTFESFLTYPNNGTPMENMMLQMEAMNAQVQYDSIKKTLNGGKMASRLRGSNVDWNPPFGYVSVREGSSDEYKEVDGKRKRTRKMIHLEIIEENAAFVKLLFEKCIELKSIDALMLYLEENEIRFPKGEEAGRIPFTSEVVDILKNETYIGNLSTLRKGYELKSRKYHKMMKRLRSDWVVVKDACPKIVDEETFRQAQKVAILFREKTRRSNAAPLSNLVVCGKCKSPMSFEITEKETKKGHVVRVELRKCAKKFKFTNFNNQLSCTNRGVRAESLLDEILHDVDLKISELQGVHEEEEEAVERMLDSYNRRLQELRTAFETYRIAVSDRQIDRAEGSILMKNAENEEDFIVRRMEIMQLPERFKPIAVTKQERREALESFRESFSHDLSFKEQNLLLKTIIDSVEYYRMDDCPDMLKDVPEGVKYVLKINYR